MGTPDDFPPGLPPGAAFAKRTFDVAFSLGGLLLVWWLIGLCWVAATVDTRQNGFFTQQRVGRDARGFTAIRLRTMRPVEGVATTATTSLDPRITSLGAFLRRSKLDELPQLWNVLLGPDEPCRPPSGCPWVRGRADRGGPRAAVGAPGRYRSGDTAVSDEETVLAGVEDPDRYNERVIWPEKVRINREYVQNYRFSDDLRYIWRTVAGR